MHAQECSSDDCMDMDTFPVYPDMDMYTLKKYHGCKSVYYKAHTEKNSKFSTRCK